MPAVSLQKSFMKAGVFCIALLFASVCGISQTEKGLPAEIEQFILKGHQLLDFVTGDLNGDKRPDAILILKIAGEDTLQREDDTYPKRPMLLLVRQHNGALKLAARNDTVVMCRQCGGIFGDPYESVSIEKAAFSINFYGGSAWRWSHEYSFRYNPLKKDWFIYRESQTSYWNGDPDKSFSSATVASDELPVLSFSQYRPLHFENGKEKKWKVKSSKANFYGVASKKSKPLKAYLVKGDVISSHWETGNFIFVEYENKNGKSTKGFIKKEEVNAVQQADK
jgi:hypothetical protein